MARNMARAKCTVQQEAAGGVVVCT